MIPVAPQSKPIYFTEDVYRRGKDALQAAGKPLPNNFWQKHSYWLRCRQQLYRKYGGYCAYLGVLIYQHKSVKNYKKSSLDHYLPKKDYPKLAYVWRNYRLSSALVNANKGSHTGILDPFRIKSGWFEVEFVGGTIYPAPGLPAPLSVRIRDTIDKLDMNNQTFCTLRLAIFENTCDVTSLAKESPFLYQEALRQNLITAEGILRTC